MTYTYLVPWTMECPSPVVVGVFHGFGLEVLGAVDEVFEGVEAEAEVLPGVHPVSALVVGTFVMGVECLGSVCWISV